MTVEATTLYQSIKAKSINADLHYYKNSNDIDHPDAKSFVSAKSTTILNARECASLPCLEQEGFCVINHNVKLQDLNDEKKLYEDARLIGEQVKIVARAKNYMLLGAIIRHEQTLTIKHDLYDRPPANHIHADWSAARLKKLGFKKDRSLPINQEITLNKTRDFINSAKVWGIYNAWLPIKTVINNPLALCDRTSVNKNDIINHSQVKKHDQDTEVRRLKYRDTYRWLYYPMMQSNELLIFKQFESGRGFEAYIPVFHTAFKVIEDKNINTNKRDSIEFRFLLKH